MVPTKYPPTKFSKGVITFEDCLNVGSFARDGTNGHALVAARMHRKSLHCRRNDTVLSVSLRMMQRGEEESQIEGPCEFGGAREGMKVL